MKNLSLSGFVFLVFILQLSVCNSSANVFPAEGANLNYRIIGFSFPIKTGYLGYKIQIARGKIFDASLFRPEMISPDSKSNRIIAEVPDFGADYTWRILYATAQNKTIASELYHFSTLSIPSQNDAETRLRVTQKNDSCNDFYVLVDGRNRMYDKNGNPIWFLPKINDINVEDQDMEFTSQHTISFLYGIGACEINYNGKVLWKAPESSALTANAANSTIVVYHHEFSRLENGYYMALCNMGHKPRPSEKMDNLHNNNDSGHHFFPTNPGGSMLLEFDSLDNVVWSWSSEDYLTHSDIGYFRNDISKLLHVARYDGHENSFYFDEQNKVIYLSYAAFNRIIKISYPSGKILNVYGKTYDTATSKDMLQGFDPGTAPINGFIANSLFINTFSGQHACRKTKDGSLVLYNDNMLKSGNPPQVLVFEEPKKDDPGGLKILWEFNCPIDSQYKNSANGGGGSAYEMTDGSFFVTMNYPHGKIFIVNKDKAIIWSAMPEIEDWQNIWKTAPAYRSSVVDRAGLEQLIWSSEGMDNNDSIEPAPILAGSTN